MPTLGTMGKICCEREVLLNSFEFEWKVRKFSSLSKETDCCYCSHPFEFGDRSWYLDLYPNGDTRESKGYISLFLMPRSTGPPVKVKFFLGVKTAEGETEVWTSFKHTFRKNTGYGGFRCIRRSELFRRRDELLPLDVLTISLTCQVELLMRGNKNVSIQTEGEDTIADVEKGGPSEKSGAKSVSVQTLIEYNGAEVSVQTEVEDKVVDGGKDESVEKTGTKNVPVEAGAESHTTDVSVQTLFEYNGAEVFIQRAVRDKVTDGGKDESVEKTGREKVLQDVRMLWASGDNSDVIIRVRDVEFKAHKTILAARTPVLGAMFRHDTTEKNSGEVTIDDCEPEVFEQILHYIYTGAPRVLTAENASALYVVADKYLVNEVKALCVRCMQDTLCLDTFCNTVTLSLMYREQELLEVTIDFLSKNVIDVMKTVEWQVFLRDHSTRANEILIRALELEARNERKEAASVSRLVGNLL